MQGKSVDTWASNSLSVKAKGVVGVHLKMEAKHLGVSSQLKKVSNDFFIVSLKLAIRVQFSVFIIPIDVDLWQVNKYHCLFARMDLP